MSKSKDTKGTDFGDTKQVAHYMAILVEDLKDQFKFVIEHVSGMEERFIQRMDERFARHEKRLDRIKIVLTGHSQMHQKHEARLDKMNFKLDRIIGKIEEHDHDIRLLKTEVFPH